MTTDIVITNEDLEAYLLGQTPEAEADMIMDRLYSSEALFHNLEIVEMGLIDSYVREEMPADKRELFDQNYLVTRENKRKVSEAAIFHEELQELAVEEAMVPAAAAAASTGGSLRRRFTAFFMFPAFKWAYAVLILLAIGGTALVFSRYEDVKKTIAGVFAAPTPSPISVPIPVPIPASTPTPTQTLALVNSPTPPQPVNKPTDKRDMQNPFAKKDAYHTQGVDLKYGSMGTNTHEIDRRNRWWKSYFGTSSDCPPGTSKVKIKITYIKNDEPESVFMDNEEFTIDKNGYVTMTFETQRLKEGRYTLTAQPCSTNIDFWLKDKKLR